MSGFVLLQGVLVTKTVCVARWGLAQQPGRQWSMCKLLCCPTSICSAKISEWWQIHTWCVTHEAPVEVSECSSLPEPDVLSGYLIGLRTPTSNHRKHIVSPNTRKVKGISGVVLNQISKYTTAESDLFHMVMQLINEWIVINCFSPEWGLLQLVFSWKVSAFYRNAIYNILTSGNVVQLYKTSRAVISAVVGVRWKQFVKDKMSHYYCNIVLFLLNHCNAWHISPPIYYHSFIRCLWALGGCDGCSSHLNS